MQETADRPYVERGFTNSCLSCCSVTVNLNSYAIQFSHHLIKPHYSRT